MFTPAGERRVRRGCGRKAADESKAVRKGCAVVAARGSRGVGVILQRGQELLYGALYRFGEILDLILRTWGFLNELQARGIIHWRGCDPSHGK